MAKASIRGTIFTSHRRGGKIRCFFVCDLEGQGTLEGRERETGLVRQRETKDIRIMFWVVQALIR